MGVSALAGTPFVGIGTPILGVDGAGNLSPIAVGGDSPATNEVHAPATHTAAVLTWAAEANKAHVVKDIVFSYASTGTITTGNLIIADGSDTIFNVDITIKDVVTLPITRKGHAGRAMTITLADAGADVTGKLNATHYLVNQVAGGELDLNDEMNSGLLMLFW